MWFWLFMVVFLGLCNWFWLSSLVFIRVLLGLRILVICGVVGVF